jgi:hypothetical protein
MLAHNLVTEGTNLTRLQVGHTGFMKALAGCTDLVSWHYEIAEDL